MPDGVTLNQWVPKGWGGEVIVVNTPEYCGKRLLVLAGRRCSILFHEKKTETFCVASGDITVRLRRRNELTWSVIHRLRAGGSVHVPAGTEHQFQANADTWLIEFSTHDDPADSIRIERGDVLPGDE